MKPDALGLIFKVEKRLGRGDIFEIISHFPNGSRKTSFFHHEFHDGMGALLCESKHWSGATLSPPLFKLNSALSFKEVIEGLRGLKEDMTPTLTRWKRLDTQAPYSPRHLAWRILSPSATQMLLKSSRARGISLNTLLLWAAQTTIENLLLSQDQTECRWLIPVNMRRTPAEQFATHNCTSSIGLRCPRGSSPDDIESAYRRALNRWRALGAHALAHAAANLGEQQLFRLAQRRARVNGWIGSFTNLGAWTFPDVHKEDHWPRALSITPPAGTPCFPVGIGIITWQGHLSISVRLHPGLCVDDEYLHETVISGIHRTLSEMVSSDMGWALSSNVRTKADDLSTTGTRSETYE